MVDFFNRREEPFFNFFFLTFSLTLTIYIPLLTQEKPFGGEIPAYPIFNASFNSQVSYVESLNVVYIQNYNYSLKLADLLDELYNFYETGGMFCFICMLLMLICGQTPLNLNK